MILSTVKIIILSSRRNTSPAKRIMIIPRIVDIIVVEGLFSALPENLHHSRPLSKHDVKNWKTLKLSHWVVPVPLIQVHRNQLVDGFFYIPVDILWWCLSHNFMGKYFTGHEFFCDECGGHRAVIHGFWNTVIIYTEND